MPQLIWPRWHRWLDPKKHSLRDSDIQFTWPRYHNSLDLKKHILDLHITDDLTYYITQLTWPRWLMLLDLHHTADLTYISLTWFISSAAGGFYESVQWFIRIWDVLKVTFRITITVHIICNKVKARSHKVTFRITITVHIICNKVKARSLKVTFMITITVHIICKQVQSKVKFK